MAFSGAMVPRMNGVINYLRRIYLEQVGIIRRKPGGLFQAHGKDLSDTCNGFP